MAPRARWKKFEGASGLTLHPPRIPDRDIEEYERVYDDLAHCSQSEDLQEDKETWRGGWYNMYSMTCVVIKDNDYAAGMLERCGFGDILTIQFTKSAKRLCGSLVERWWDTTHTFHLPRMEIGLTPLDFTFLTGISVGLGRPLPYVADKKSKWASLHEKYFPDLPYQENKGGDKCKGVYVSILRNWLDAWSKRVPGDELPSAAQKRQIYHAFILWMIGSVFFPIQRLITENEGRGFPGMLGSVDCMHWKWKNCPSGWQGMYTGGKSSKPTVILEAVADKSGWFWHANFGIPGSNNDLNVLKASSLFTQVLKGEAPPCNFNVNGRAYKQGYYLGDGIYPAIATIVKGYKANELDIEGPRSYFNQKQESVRKDVERAFGILQGCFETIKHPCRYMEPKQLGDIMRACVILNNMIVEDQRVNQPYADEELSESEFATVGLDMNVIRANYENIYDADRHRQLRVDLTAHNWNNRVQVPQQ